VPNVQRHVPEHRSIKQAATATWELSSQIFNHYESQYYLSVKTNLKYHFHVTSNYRANRNKLFLTSILILAVKVNGVLL